MELEVEDKKYNFIINNFFLPPLIIYPRSLLPLEIAGIDDESPS